ncbi:MAG: glucose 1-dehydrogenase [Acidimicrobiia bacterium]|nr:glucose 1-dehydrogenase [Acidimicrobiia bacterium]
MSSNRLTALVTGASSGIGAATAVELARRGMAVAVHYFNNEAGAHQTVHTIRAAGGEAIAIKADVRQRSDVESMVAEVLKTFGTIDVLVNNAGSLVARVPFLETTDEHWEDVLRLNLSSVFYCTRAVARHMAKQSSGIVINVASIAARHGGGPGAICYGAAKGAVLAMTKGLAKELAPYGIRVNGVNPGVILTPFHERFTSEELMKRMVDSIPLKRAGASEETATVIAFLASKDAQYLAGETIEVNGGQLMD